MFLYFWLMFIETNSGKNAWIGSKSKLPRNRTPGMHNSKQIFSHGFLKAQSSDLMKMRKIWSFLL